MSGAGLNIVILGRDGQIAWELQRRLPDLGRVTVIGRPEIDLSRPDSLRRAIRELSPDVLVNASAYTAVDQAENEPELALALNATAPQVLAEEARRINALFVTYSSDYVFDGTKAAFYTEEDLGHPLNVYGRSKLAGDQAVQAVGGDNLILRTSWVYGARGKNFLRTISALALQRDEIRVVDDQVGAPTSSYDIAQATAQIVAGLRHRSGRIAALGKRSGIYNMTSQGAVSWCGFATAILDQMRDRGLKQALARIVPIPSKEYPTPAERPRNSRLSNAKLQAEFGIALRDWRQALAATMEMLDLPARDGCSVGPGGR